MAKEHLLQCRCLTPSLDKLPSADISTSPSWQSTKEKRAMQHHTPSIAKPCKTTSVSRSAKGLELLNQAFRAVSVRSKASATSGISHAGKVQRWFEILFLLLPWAPWARFADQTYKETLPGYLLLVLSSLEQCLLYLSTLDENQSQGPQHSAN